MIDLLINKIKEKNNPSVIGLDPAPAFIPDFIKLEAFSQHGKTPQGMSAAFYAFNVSIIDAIYDLIPAVKPQIAMYEQFGAPGIECYIKTAAYAKAKGLIVIGDVKRGDIASTAQAYADGHIGGIDINGEVFSIFGEDFITVNPYLGADSIEPFAKNCKKHDKGIFVLVKTSNPGGADIQDIPVNTGEARTVAEHVGLMVSHIGEEHIGSSGFSDICAVVGATYPDTARRLRELMPHTFFLVPGYGAQGGCAETLNVYFTNGIEGAIVNSSRGIIAAHQNKYKGAYGERDFAKAARQAVIDMQKDIVR